MDTSTRRRPDVASGRSWVPLLAVSLGYFMVVLDATAVNLALPALRQDLGGGITGLQWVVDGYTLAFAALLLLAGVAGDRFGPRRMFLAGLSLFTAASADCALAPTIGVLVLIRLIQGAAAALLVPSSLALLQASYPDPAQRARAVGMWGGIGAGRRLRTRAGRRADRGRELAAGVRDQYPGRPARLVAHPPPGRLAQGSTGSARRPHRPDHRDRGADRLIAGLIEAGPHGWVSWPVAAGLAIAAAGTVAFVAAQRRVRSPMLPLALLRRPALSGGSVVGLLINLGFYGQLFAYSLYLQRVRGDSPLIAGLSLLPEAVAVPVAAVLFGRLTSHRGPRITMIAGLVLGAAGLLGLIVTARGTPYWVLVLPMVAAGSGMALTMPAATTAVMDAAPDNRSGTAAGLINTARQVGGALGVAIAGSLVSGAIGFVPGLHVALAVCGGAFLLGAVVTAATVGRNRAGRQPA